MTRTDAIKELENIRDNFNYTLAPNEVFEMAIKALEQAPRTGHWIATEDGFECSECGCISRSRADFCQYCGAKMVEPPEKEAE